jgi:hypothetical protein
VKISRYWAELVSGQPQIDVCRLDLADLATRSARPVRFDSFNDVGLALYRFRFLMLNRAKIDVAQFSERDLTF